VRNWRANSLKCRSCFNLSHESAKTALALARGKRHEIRTALPDRVSCLRRRRWRGTGGKRQRTSRRTRCS
jgi:hypothetical protein